jgi:IstB-like ATP binding protein
VGPFSTRILAWGGPGLDEKYHLPFGEWGQVFQGERMTAALLDRLTHRCHIFEMNGESYRFRESMKTRKDKDPKKGK